MVSDLFTYLIAVMVYSVYIYIRNRINGNHCNQKLSTI